VDLQIYPIEYGGLRHAAVVLRDVTERNRLQSRLRRAETMEAVGTMASGLAHDFNNLLTSVMGTLSSLASEFTASTHTEHIRSALRACRTAAGLSKRLLGFADSTEGTPQAFGLAETIETIIDSLDSSFFDGIEVWKQLDHSVQTKMDPDQFTQVAMNLLRNARDAMQKNGRLRISVSSITAENPDTGAGEQPYALLVLEDSGGGMAPDVQKRAFEPFFTTKSRAERRGRGLGLAIVYSAVNNAGGFVQVESRPGEGTMFRVYLPTAEPIAEYGAPDSPSVPGSGAR
jgi:signal transduction histidine kinase